MENITKALIITGGILLAVMILSLVVTFWSQMSGYYAEQHQSKITEQNAEFNSKFENYNGQTIRGNELISVMNKVVNYNNSVVGNEGNYDKIIMSIDFKGYQNTAFKFSQADVNRFNNIINGNKLSNSKSSDANLEKITNLPATIASQSGISNIRDEQLQKLSSEINNLTGDDVDVRNKKLQSILGLSKDEAKNMSQSQLTQIIDTAKKYYQYTQLKRAMFKCTQITHNSTSNGRINGMEFEVVVENGNVKFN